MMNKEQTPSGPRRVGAVIVSYFPDVSSLTRNIEALLPQIGHVVIVDNGSGAEQLQMLSAMAESEKTTLISFRENRGVATAQNSGIAQIKAMGFEFVILFDQDSLAAPGMVDALLKAYETHTAEGMHVAAVGPLTVDARTGNEGSFATFSRGRIVQHSGTSATMQVDLLISSGCMMPITALEEVGPMNSDYFIDNVDTEWCIRARIKGWVLFGVPDARLFHNLGDRVVRVWLGRWRNVSVHTPLRDYYICRNSLFMLRLSGLPLSWAFALLARLLMFIVFSFLALPPRLERLRKITLGISHGLCKRTAPVR